MLLMCEINVKMMNNDLKQKRKMAITSFVLWLFNISMHFKKMLRDKSLIMFKRPSVNIRYNIKFKELSWDL